MQEIVLYVFPQQNRMKYTNVTSHEITVSVIINLSVQGIKRIRKEISTPRYALRIFNYNDLMGVYTSQKVKNRCCITCTWRILRAIKRNIRRDRFEVKH